MVTLVLAWVDSLERFQRYYESGHISGQFLLPAASLEVARRVAAFFVEAHGSHPHAFANSQIRTMAPIRIGKPQ
jgi:hypothetical protein